MLPSLSFIIGTRVAKSRKLVTWPWVRNPWMIIARSSNRLSDSTLIQSEKKLKTGSDFPDLSFPMEVLTISGVTFVTSFGVDLLLYISTNPYHILLVIH